VDVAMRIIISMVMINILLLCLLNVMFMDYFSGRW
jgi:hypothetical protein